MINCLLDTGPLVALLDRSEPANQLVSDCMAGLPATRFLTSGAVITEAFYFLAEIPRGPANLASFLDQSGATVLDVFTPDGLADTVRLMSKYRDTPMDYADSTLVWLAEQTSTNKVLTLDRRGFSAFRFGSNRRFKLILDRPEATMHSRSGGF